MLGRFKVLACVLLTLAAACQRSPDKPDTLHLAVIPKATTGNFWQTVHAGARKAAKDLGVEMVWVGTEKEDQRSGQITIVDSQVVNQVDGIVLAPLDGSALLKPVREAVRAKVPVVIIDSALIDGKDLTVSFVATDNRAGGELAGEEMAKLLGQKGKVVLLRHLEGSASTGKREAGFLAALKKYPHIQVISDEQYGGRDPQKAAENLLLRFSPDGALQIDGIFCSNLTTTYGMLQALRRARLTGKVKLIGFDSDESLITGMKQGEINGLVIQDPFRMGYLGVETMVKHLKGETVAKVMDTGVTFVTNANLDEPKIKALLYPDLNKWLKQD